jgi:hypothetical protein
MDIFPRPDIAEGIFYKYLEAHQNGWHATSSYRYAILTSELTFPIFNVCAGLAYNLFMCLQKNRLTKINSVCLE